MKTLKSADLYWHVFGSHRKKKLMKALLIFLFSSLLAMPLQKEFNPVMGNWAGTLKSGDTELQLIFHISKKDGALVATIDSPSQKIKEKVDDISFEDKELNINIKRFNASYTGKIVEGRMVGTWTQAGQAIPLEMERLKRIGSS